MRPLSVDKFNIVIFWFHSGQTTCQISSSTGFSVGTISKIHFEHFSDLPKSSGSYPVKLSPANVCHAVNFITAGKAETAEKNNRGSRNYPNDWLFCLIYWAVSFSCDHMILHLIDSQHVLVYQVNYSEFLIMSILHTLLIFPKCTNIVAVFWPIVYA